MNEPKITNEAACGGSALTAELGAERQRFEQWWATAQFSIAPNVITPDAYKIWIAARKLDSNGHERD